MKTGKFLCQNQGEDDLENDDWEKEDDNDWENDDINSENDKYESLYKYYYEFTKWEAHPQKEISENIEEVKAHGMKHPGCVLSRNSDDRYAIIGVAFAYPLSLDENYQSYFHGYADSLLSSQEQIDSRQ